MSRVENALMSLYESSAVRDELTDDEAQALLSWAEGEINRIDQTSASDDVFAAQVDTLLSLLKQMNRYAGRQGQFGAQGADVIPQKIAELAGEIGMQADTTQVTSAGTGDPASTVAALTALLSGQTAAPTDAETPPITAEAQTIPSPPPAEVEAETPPPAPEMAAIPHEPITHEAPPEAASGMMYLPLTIPGDDIDNPYDQH